MSTIQYQKIGLQLAGTKSRQGGFSPRIAIGMLAGGEKADNMYRATLVSENPMCVVRHAKDYIVYELIDRKVRACDIDTLGALGIIMTVARDMQFADGKSPYEVLHEVYEKYRTSYMKRDSDGVYRFLDIDVNPDEFTEIVARYPLEPRRGTYVEMNPAGMTATLCVQPDKLPAFFRDTQYPEFSQFKEVEVGVSCATITGLNHLEIPRRKKYSVVVNDLLKGNRKNAEGIFLSLPTDQFDVSKLLHNTMDLLYDNVFFTLSQLQENGGKLNIEKSTVVIDEDKERIECSVHGGYRYYDMEYTLTGFNREEQYEVTELIRSGKVKILLDNQPMTFTSQKTQVLVSQAHKPVTISNPTSDYLLMCQYEPDNQARCLKVTIQGKKQKPVGVVHSRDTYNNNENLQNSCPSQSDSLHDSYNSEDQSDENTRKKGLIPFLIGLVVGLLICSFISWAVSSFMIDNKKNKEISVLTAQVDSLVTVVDSLKAVNLQTQRQNREKVVVERETAIVPDNNVIEKEEKKVKEEKAKEKEKESAKEKEQKCNELLKKINTKEFVTFNQNGKEYKKYFQPKEQARIEAVTNLKQYNQYQKGEKKLKPATAEKIKEDIKTMWPINGFKTLEEVYQFRDDVIMPYINDENNFQK